MLDVVIGVERCPTNGSFWKGATTSYLFVDP